MLELELEELDELEDDFDSLDDEDSEESLDTGSELLSVLVIDASLLVSLLSWLLFGNKAHEERINVDKKATLKNNFLFIGVTPLLLIFSYMKS